MRSWAAMALALASATFGGPGRAEDLPRVSLQSAVRSALEKNPSAIVATEEIRRAQALVEQARAGSLPNLTGNVVYTRLDSDRLLTERVIASADTLSANLQLVVPLVHPQRWAQWSRARENVAVVLAGDADVRRQLAVAVARAYLAVIAQKRVLGATQRARDTAKAHFDFAHARVVGGVGNRIDEVRAEQELAADDAQLHASVSGLARVREALGVLLGVDGPVDALDDPELAEAPPLSRALDETRTRRADVKAGEKRVALAEHVVRDNWTDYSPYLVGVAQPFYQNPPSLVQPLTGWQAQLLLTLPIYDGGLRYGQAKEREVLVDEARTQLEGTLRQARSDVRTAFAALREADEALGAARDAARLAVQALSLANLAYSAGATTNLEVIDAERRARDAETQAVVAEDNARQARLDLLSASGRFP